jgi:hypothetical protein
MVDTCRAADESREALPHAVGPERDVSGWIEDGYVLGAAMSGSCLYGGVHVSVASYTRMDAGDSFGATWAAPPTTRLQAVRMLFYAALTNHAAQGEGTSHISIRTDRKLLIDANSVYSTPDEVAIDRRVADASALQIAFSCNDSCSAPRSDWMYGYLQQAIFTVVDDIAPTGEVSGPAVAATIWSGGVELGLKAHDAGSGASAAIIEVDGRDAYRLPLSGGFCASMKTRNGVRVFDAAQPCPVDVEARKAIDTAALPQGDHTVRILLEDASGNRTSVFGPVTRRIDANNSQIGPGSDPARRGALNGDKATDDVRMTAHWGVRGRKSLLKSGFGRRHVISGRLTTALGEPIAGATLDVVSKTTAVNARELAKRGPQTTSDGGFSIVLPRGVSSRDLALRYRSHVADTIAVASASLRLRVRAGVRLTVIPRRAVRGQTVRFHGRLLGGPIPRGGKQLVMTVRGQTGGWLRFDVVRTDSHGRFSLGYRFKQPGTARYRFRALSLAEAAYPYLAGGSNVAAVRKR